jgi:hypothetical protein
VFQVGRNEDRRAQLRGVALGILLRTVGQAVGFKGVDVILFLHRRCYRSPPPFALLTTRLTLHRTAFETTSVPAEANTLLLAIAFPND